MGGKSQGDEKDKRGEKESKGRNERGRAKTEMAEEGEKRGGQRDRRSKRKQGRGEVGTRKRRHRGKDRHMEKQMELQDTIKSSHTKPTSVPSIPPATPPRGGALLSTGCWSFGLCLSLQGRKLGAKGKCPLESVPTPHYLKSLPRLPEA
jgi:hypothetical protein